MGPIRSQPLIPALLTLAFALIALSDAPLVRAEAGPEAASRSPELERRLADALAAKGPAYRPRSEHLLSDGRPRFTNRLILEDSPYLIQHAHNPVDWCYAIDHDWLVPHFEKMLYDQAQLAWVYARAWRLTGDPELARTARRTLEWVLRDLTSPEGGFYSATDADSEGEEGRFFLWTPAEIRAVLDPKDADLAIRFYGVSEAGNFAGRNILHVPVAPEDFAAATGISVADLWQRLERIDQALYQARETRPHPHRDEKILTGWTGMMIAALAEAGDALGEPRYVAAA